MRADFGRNNCSQWIEADYCLRMCQQGEMCKALKRPQKLPEGKRHQSRAVAPLATSRAWGNSSQAINHNQPHLKAPGHAGKSVPKHSLPKILPRHDVGMSRGQEGSPAGWVPNTLFQSEPLAAGAQPVCCQLAPVQGMVLGTFRFLI